MAPTTSPPASPRTRIDHVLVETHVLLWWQDSATQVSSKAMKAIEHADQVMVSTISIWEIAMLVKKGRVALDRPVLVWVNALLQSESISLAELSPQIAVAAGELKTSMETRLTA